MSPATIPYLELGSEEMCAKRPRGNSAGTNLCLSRKNLQERQVPNQMTKYFMVGLGGALGSILRFWISGHVGNRMGGRFPYGTFLVNCTGCFLIGLVVTLLVQRSHDSPNWRYLIPIGFIGGYTTFSAFELETFGAFHDGELLIAGLNVVLSVVVGFVSVWLGVITGRSIS
jgi:fluoride exporter